MRVSEGVRREDRKLSGEFGGQERVGDLSESCLLEGCSPLQYSCLENPVDRGAWWAAVFGVAQSQTRLQRLSMHACIEEGNGNHSSVLAWSVPGTEEPGGLPSVGSHRVRHDCSDSAAAAAAAAAGDTARREWEAGG